jgi:cell division protein FtsL
MDTHNVSVNPKELERARSMWGEFTRFAKVSIIAIVVLLVLMALFLL